MTTGQEAAFPNRKIKFKAWNVRDNKPYELDFGLEIGDEGLILIPGGVVIIQSTGLYDSNACEIWEGDIIRFCGDSRVRGQYEVSHPIRKINYREHSASFSDGIGNGLNHEALFERWEVIGNIYENPELLKP